MAKYKNVFKLEDILLEKQYITNEQIIDAVKIQKKSGESITDILIEKSYVSEEKVLSVLSNQLGLKIVNLDDYVINGEAARAISEKLARRTNSIPLKISGKKILIAMNNPLNLNDIDDIEIMAGRKAEIVLALKFQINNAIDKYIGRSNTEKAAEDFNNENYNFESKNIDEDYDINVMNSPVVRFINSLIRQAIRTGASDIHIEPYKNRIRVRFRIDGDLNEIVNISKNIQSAIITRVKIMAGMDIAEKRLPQDGRLEMTIEKSVIDLRISVFPTVYGEKIVMRILNRQNFLRIKTELGFTEQNMKLYESILSAPNGIVLIAGPTGSGKTTTLYTVLNELNNMNKNIITLEDPVEYKLDGINQVQVNLKAGLNFSAGLRSILRQDPDIIMVGEIRDEDTAEIAVRAAITGHLVISTIHTNDAPSAIVRLQNMGIKPYLTAAALRGVIAQRLVKRICSSCKEQYPAGKMEKTLLGVKKDVMLFRGKGCPKCYYTGYRGRIAVHEIMRTDKSLRDIIYAGGSLDEITNMAKKGGMTTLTDNCRELVLSGITTLEEYSRAVYRLD